MNMDQIKKLHFIILFLCILSLILGICIVYQIHEKKWMNDDIPMSYFEDKDYSEKSFHINDYRNYGYGKSNFDIKRGVFLREKIESDFFFKPQINMDTKDWELTLKLNLFNYGEEYRILQNVNDDLTVQLVDNFVSQFRYGIMDKSAISIKRELNNPRYGEAGLTDLYLNTYNEVTKKQESTLHKDIFVTPLALKHMKDDELTGCLVLFQFFKIGPDNFSSDVVSKEVIAYGTFLEEFILKNHPQMLYSKKYIDNEIVDYMVKQIITQ